MVKQKQQHDLVALVHLVKGLVAAMPAFSWQHPAPFRSAEEALVATLREQGARITSGSDVSITLGGVRSTSTGGTTAAVRNWIGAAQRHLDRQAIARITR